MLNTSRVLINNIGVGSFLQSNIQGFFQKREIIGLWTFILKKEIPIVKDTMPRC